MDYSNAKSTPMTMPKPALRFKDQTSKAIISSPKAVSKSSGTPRYMQPGKVQVGRPMYTP